MSNKFPELRAPKASDWKKIIARFPWWESAVIAVADLMPDADESMNESRGFFEWVMNSLSEDYPNLIANETEYETFVKRLYTIYESEVSNGKHVDEALDLAINLAVDEISITPDAEIEFEETQNAPYAFEIELNLHNRRHHRDYILRVRSHSAADVLAKMEALMEKLPVAEWVQRQGSNGGGYTPPNTKTSQPNSDSEKQLFTRHITGLRREKATDKNGNDYSFWNFFYEDEKGDSKQIGRLHDNDRSGVADQLREIVSEENRRHYGKYPAELPEDEQFIIHYWNKDIGNGRQAAQIERIIRP